MHACMASLKQNLTLIYIEPSTFERKIIHSLASFLYFLLSRSFSFSSNINLFGRTVHSHSLSLLIKGP